MKVDNDSCSSKSFLIGDGVCDEVVNRRRCLYDGNDCCLERKLTHLCQDCTCRLDVHPVEMMAKRKAKRVSVYSGEKKKHKFVVLKKVEEVQNTTVCEKLCMDFSEMDQYVDSWKFELSTNRSCFCMKFEDCYQKCDR